MNHFGRLRRAFSRPFVCRPSPHISGSSSVVALSSFLFSAVREKFQLSCELSYWKMLGTNRIMTSVIYTHLSLAFSQPLSSSLFGCIHDNAEKKSLCWFHRFAQSKRANNVEEVEKY